MFETLRSIAMLAGFQPVDDVTEATDGTMLFIPVHVMNQNGDLQTVRFGLPTVSVADFQMHGTFFNLPIGTTHGDFSVVSADLDRQSVNVDNAAEIRRRMTCWTLDDSPQDITDIVRSWLALGDEAALD